MKKVIVGIHGLGNKPPKDILNHWWKLSIVEGLRKSKISFPKPKFELVFWADVIHKELLDLKITDCNSPLYISEKYLPFSNSIQHSPSDNRKKILKFIENQMDKIFLNDDLSINFEGLNDKVIGKYFSELEYYYSGVITSKNGENIPAKIEMRNRLIEVLEKYKHHKILLIAHSMGTIIAYDVLTLARPDIKIDTLITIGSPLGLPVIMHKHAIEKGTSSQDKSKLQVPQNIISNWLNFSDLEDKIAVNYDLSDDYDPNDEGVAVQDFVVLNDYTSNDERNPHKSFGYLRTKELSENVYKFLMSDKPSILKGLNNSLNNIFKKVTQFFKKQ